jgi:ribosomal-protein-alanine N-acetyltransferase
MGRPAVAVRPMRWWDLPAVLGIEQVAFAADPPWSPAQFWSELALVPESRAYWVAADEAGAVVGYAGLAVGLDGADVQTLAVAPGRQRGGIGSQLLGTLLAEAGVRRAGPVRLEVRADNGAAQALYAGHGFVVVGRRRGYYTAGAAGGRREDALLLQRPAPTPRR